MNSTTDDALEDAGAVAASVLNDAARSKRRKIIIIAAAAAATLLASGGAAAWFMMGNSDAGAAESVKPVEAIYVDVPPIVVNVTDAEGRMRFLKVRIVLAVEDAETAELAKARMVALVDPMLGFLRELRPEDLAGSQAMFRIKEEMLIRAAQVLAPGRVHDVLIQELVQQ